MGSSLDEQHIAHERFRLVQRIGNGRWSTVFLAEDGTLNQSVALKVVRPKTGSAAHLRLLREAEALRRIDHPNVLRILDSGISPNLGHYIVAQYHQGRTIAELITEHGRLPEDWIRKVMTQLLSALRAVHSLGGVHGDITPANCLCVGFGSFAEDPALCLLDFGASRWESEQPIDAPLTGTPVYMSPEHAHGHALTPASDIYSAGVLAYEMLLGVPPFRASTSTEVLWQQVHEAPRRPREIVSDGSISPMLEQAILRALAKDPARRFGSAHEFAKALALDDVWRAGGVGTTTRPPPELHEDIRHALLARVRQHWVEGVLSRTTDGVILVNQAMWRADGLVTDPTSTEMTDLDVGIADVFDEHEQSLLLLGDAGHGKTVNLLRLARRLADRAVDSHGVATKVPVVFTLSAWTSKDNDLIAWMTKELSVKYLIPKRDAARLFAESSIVPLLDGLDDLDLAARAKCATAINEYRRAYPRNGIVVTCRTNDYAHLPTPVRMNVAVVLRELTEREIGRQLRATSQLELLSALDDSRVLEELSRTPVLLHVMRVALRDSVVFRGALTNRRDAVKELFEAFIASVCRSHEVNEGDVRNTLERAAHLMLRTGRTLLLLEDAQPSWLRRFREQVLYAIVSRGIVASLFGASIVLAVARTPLDNGGFRTSIPFGLRLGAASALVLTIGFGGHAIWRLWRPSKASPGARLRILVAVGAGLVLGSAIGGIAYCFDPHSAAFAMGVECGVVGATLLAVSRTNRGDLNTDITTIESVGWSWRYIRPGMLLVLAAFSASLFVVARSFEGLSAAVYDAWSVLLLGLAVLGYRTRSVYSRLTPNVGIHLTARNSAVAAVVAFIATALLFGVTYGIGYGACVAVTLATVTGLWFGGIDVIHHYTVRTLLHFDRSLDMRITRSLDEAVDLGLMRRVGNGYMFMHSMLLEHMATRSRDAK
jgi:eukaryotic-like serine/threonine-protein kinase